MGRLAQRVTDARVLKLVRAFLNAGVLENGLVSATEEGTPQGGPLSPFLSNIVLHALDCELEGRGHRFVRYADDCNVYVRSARAGHRVMASITLFITTRLKLKVNAAKSAVAAGRERTFLGFSFTHGQRPKRRLADKTLVRFRARVRTLTRRVRGVSLRQMVKELAAYVRGWRAYFGFCETPTILRRLDKWIRRRLRAVVWKQWAATRHSLPTAAEAGRQREGCDSHGSQQPRTVARVHHGGAVLGAARCLLRLARLALSRAAVTAQPAEPPWYGPVCPVVWEGRHREVSPYPDHGPRALSAIDDRPGCPRSDDRRRIDPWHAARARGSRIMTWPSVPRRVPGSRMVGPFSVSRCA